MLFRSGSLAGHGRRNAGHRFNSIRSLEVNFITPSTGVMTQPSYTLLDSAKFPPGVAYPVLRIAAGSSEVA